MPRLDYIAFSPNAAMVLTVRTVSTLEPATKASSTTSAIAMAASSTTVGAAAVLTGLYMLSALRYHLISSEKTYLEYGWDDDLDARHHRAAQHGCSVSQLYITPVSMST